MPACVASCQLCMRVTKLIAAYLAAQYPTTDLWLCSLKAQTTAGPYAMRPLCCNEPCAHAQDQAHVSLECCSKLLEELEELEKPELYTSHWKVSGNSRNDFTCAGCSF